MTQKLVTTVTGITETLWFQNCRSIDESEVAVQKEQKCETKNLKQKKQIESKILGILVKNVALYKNAHELSLKRASQTQT